MNDTHDAHLHEELLHDDPEIHRRRWFLLGVMCLCLVMIVMAVSGLNVAIPHMQQDLGADGTDLQWILDSYAIIFAGLLLTAGALGDRFGRKLALQAGLVIFLIGSVIGSLADTVGGVITARVIMGAGAAFIMPATLSLITAVFPPHERGRAIAIWAGFAGAGGALGPLLVGALLTGVDLGFVQVGPYWFGSSFLANLIAIVPTLVAISLFAPRSKDPTSRPLDPVGALLSIVALSAALYGIIEGPTRGWTDAWVMAGFAAGIVGGALFVAWELRQTYPMLPMQFFRDRRFNFGSGVITVSFMVMFGFFLLSAQYLQFVRGYSPLRAGASTLPMAFMMILVAPRSASLADRYGYKVVVGVAGFIGAAGFVLLSFLEADSSYWLFGTGVMVLGFGQGLSAPPSTGAIMSSVPLNQAGVASAVNDTTRELGGAFGIAILGSIVNSLYRGDVDVSGLPPDLAAVAGESIGGARGVAERIGGAEGEALIRQAGQSFTEALSVATLVAAGVLVVSGIVVRLFGHKQNYATQQPQAPADPSASEAAALVND